MQRRQDTEQTREAYAQSGFSRAEETLVAGPYVIEYLGNVPLRRGTGDGIRVLKHDPLTDGFTEVTREGGPKYYDRLFEPLVENHSRDEVVTLVSQFETRGEAYLWAYYENKFGRQDLDEEKVAEILAKLEELQDL